MLSAVPIANTQDFNRAYAGFTPSYSFNIFQNIKNEDVAKLNLKMQQAYKNSVRLAVIGQVAGGYFTLLGLHKQLELEKQMVADLEENRKYIKVQIANGSQSQMNLDEINQAVYNISVNLSAIRHYSR